MEIEFAVAEETDVSKVEKTLDAYVGKSLLFINTDDIKEVLKEYHYMEVLSIEKHFPNVLKLKIEERRETYYLEHGDNVYVTTADGFVLEVLSKSDYKGNTERDKITLKLKRLELEEDETFSTHDVTLEGAQVGSTISMFEDEFLSTVFELAKKVNLTDCIKELKVEKITNDTVVVARDLVITTYTGVTIRVKDADVRGEEKITRVFAEYDNASTDYKKTFDYIMVYVETVEGDTGEDGETEEVGDIVVQWSPMDNSPIK